MVFRVLRAIYWEFVVGSIRRSLGVPRVPGVLGVLFGGPFFVGVSVGVSFGMSVGGSEGRCVWGFIGGKYFKITLHVLLD